jgi:hypothetical protein
MSKWHPALIVVPIIMLVVIVAVAGGGIWWLGRPKPVTVIIDVTGTRGLPLKGTCEEDGKSRELTGVVPAKFEAHGTRILFSLTTDAQEGEFQVKAMSDDKAFEPARSDNPPKNGIHGWVVVGWGTSPPRHWVEPFPKDGEEKWMKPPP